MNESTKSFYHRNLPHWHPPGRSIFLTWRLHGSLPQTVLNQLRITRQQLSKRKLVRSAGWTNDKGLLEYKRLFAKVDTILDKAETGPLWLKEIEIADLVQQALLERYAHLYTLWAYVVMANHLHLFLKQKMNRPSDLLRNISRAIRRGKLIDCSNEQEVHSGKTNRLTTGLATEPSSLASSIT